MRSDRFVTVRVCVIFPVLPATCYRHVMFICTFDVQLCLLISIVIKSIDPTMNCKKFKFGTAILSEEISFHKFNL